MESSFPYFALSPIQISFFFWHDEISQAHLITPRFKSCLWAQGREDPCRRTRPLWSLWSISEMATRGTKCKIETRYWESTHTAVDIWQNIFVSWPVFWEAGKDKFRSWIFAGRVRWTHDKADIGHAGRDLFQSQCLIGFGLDRINGEVFKRIDMEWYGCV